MSRRFREVYEPELIELLNDEEAYIRIEAIEIVTEVMDELDEDVIVREFIPALLSIIESSIEEIMLQLASLIGKIAFKLKRIDAQRHSEEY